MKRIKTIGFGSVALAVGLLVAFITLSYVLLHNPHQELHRQIFKTADNIIRYYRDQPNYWKLSLQTATENEIVDKSLLQQKGFKLSIGHGADGEIAMPNDNNFDIALHGLSKSACINLSEFAIDEQQQLILQKITIINELGQTEFAWGAENQLPIKQYATRKICQPSNNTVTWTFQ